MLHLVFPVCGTNTVLVSVLQLYITELFIPTQKPRSNHYS